jgi:hypothetical protein
MSDSTSPGDLARIYCTQCEQVVFFTFKGGPMDLTCTTCKHVIRVEMVHDGRKWRVKDMQTVRRVRGTC